MSETTPQTGGRKAQQTKIAQWLAFALACIIMGAFCYEATTLAKAGVSADTVALILADFKWLALMSFGAVAGQLATFTWGNMRVHQSQAKGKEG